MVGGVKQDKEAAIRWSQELGYFVGDEDKAIEILENAGKLHSPIFLNRELELWFIFDRLKGNPRFDALLAD